MSNQDLNREQEKGIMVTINASGNCEHRVFGTLNEAEVLGIGGYLISLTQVNGLRGLINGQMELWKALKELTAATISLHQEGASCSTESSLESSLSEDSISSTENPGGGSSGS